MKEAEAYKATDRDESGTPFGGLKCPHSLGGKDTDVSFCHSSGCHTDTSQGEN